MPRIIDYGFRRLPMPDQIETLCKPRLQRIARSGVLSLLEFVLHEISKTCRTNIHPMQYLYFFFVIALS